MCAISCGASDVSTEQKKEIIYFQGKIDDEFYETLSELDNLEADIFVSLSGGQVETALRSAELAAKNSWTLNIQSVCFSACAEILVLGFEDINLMPGAVLGFHGNSKLKNYLYRRAMNDPSSKCFLQFESRREALMEQPRINHDFWKLQIQMLKPLNPRITYRGDGRCNLLHYSLTNDLWIPSTKQLRDEFGLEFTGNQSTDDPAYREKFNKIFDRSFDSIIFTD